MNFVKKYYWAIIPIIGWIIVRFGFDFNGLYGQDAYAYLLHTREWKAFFLGGNTPGSFFWPANYSIVSAFLALLVKTEFYSLQLVSVLSMIGLGWILDSWIKKTHQQTDEATRIVFVSIAFLVSPFMFRLGMQSMSDMLAMLFLTASFYCLSLYFQTDRIQSFLCWSAFSALAITTRYPAVVVLMPSIGFIAFQLLSRGQFKRLVIGLLVGLIPLSMAIWWKLTSGGMENVLAIDLIQDWNVFHFFQSEFSTFDTNSKFTLPNLLFNLSVWVHPGTLFLGAILFPLSFRNLRNDSVRILLLISILLYAFFLSGIPFQNSRVATFTFPLIVVFLFPGFARFTEWLKLKPIPKRYLLFAVLVIQVALCSRAVKPSISYNLFERELAAWIETNCASKTVYTSSYSQLFEVYETGNRVVQIFDAPVNAFEDDAVFIFNRSWANFKLKGTMPLQNWESAQNLMKVEEEKCWPNGWCVYSLKFR